MKVNKVLKGTIILSFAGILAKFIGFFFKVPLARFIGLEGLGIYNYPYFLYITLVALSISGIPIAISKMVSERIAINDHEGAYSVFRIALKAMTFVGIGTTIVLFFSAKLIVNLFWPSEAIYPLLGLCLAPTFLAMISVYRGYFQGMQIMKPTALSQVIEAIGRLGVGLVLASYLLKYSIAHAAGGAAFGTTFGAFLGLISFVIVYYKVKPEIVVNFKKPTSAISKIILKDIVRLALPISIGAVASSLMPLIDSLIINSRLSVAGYTVSQASELYGQLGVASTLINFPLTVSVAIAISLVPSIAESKSKSNQKELSNKIDLGIKMGALWSFPTSVGILILATPILRFIFPMMEDGHLVLQIFSVSLILMVFNQIYTSILQGYGEVMVPVKNLYIGAIIKIVMTFVLASIPWLNIKGAAIATLLSYSVIMFLNMRALKKHLNYKHDLINQIVKPILSVVLMGVSVILVFKVMNGIFASSTIPMLISILLGCMIYAIGIVATGVVQKEELYRILKRKV